MKTDAGLDSTSRKQTPDTYSPEEKTSNDGNEKNKNDVSFSKKYLSSISSPPPAIHNSSSPTLSSPSTLRSFSGEKINNKKEGKGKEEDFNTTAQEEKLTSLLEKTSSETKNPIQKLIQENKITTLEASALDPVELETLVKCKPYILKDYVSYKTALELPSELLVTMNAMQKTLIPLLDFKKMSISDIIGSKDQSPPFANHITGNQALVILKVRRLIFSGKINSNDAKDLEFSQAFKLEKLDHLIIMGKISLEDAKKLTEKEVEQIIKESVVNQGITETKNEDIKPSKEDKS